MSTLIVDGVAVELTSDAHGLVGYVELDGQRHRVFATITACTPKATTPAKYCARG